jgi:hypothetical protein
LNDRARRFESGLAPWVIVGLAAVLPYLITVNDYFVRDDFGVVQLLAQKPFSYFPRWFASSWMDEIWGFVPDEVRPFPALSYQLTALGGAVSPTWHHALNILIHAANGLLVMAIGLNAARLGVLAAMFAGLVFVLLPVHAESVAWITGRVDSMPACFYLAAFLAYVRYRHQTSRRMYIGSVVLFFVALFTKQNTITMVATLAAYDVIVLGRPIWPPVPFIRPYLPFGVMTAAYLWLRYILFGQVAREGALNARALEDFRFLLDRHFRHVVAGDFNAPAIVAWLAVAAVVFVWLWTRGRAHLKGTIDRPVEGLAPSQIDGYGRRLLYFGPVWWAIGVLPIAVAGYHSPRHVYLAAVGWAIVVAIALEAAWNVRHSRQWQRAVAAAAALVLLFYLVPLYRAVREWRTMAAVSQKITRDMRDAALSSPPGSLVIVGAPRRSWDWALPFAARPPYQRTDLYDRVFIVSPRLIGCCTGQWFEETRRAITAWSTGAGRDSAIALRWDPDNGALFQANSVDTPQLPVLIRSLLDVPRADDLDNTLNRILDVLPTRTQGGSRLRAQGSSKVFE